MVRAERRAREVQDTELTLAEDNTVSIVDPLSWPLALERQRHPSMPGH